MAILVKTLLSMLEVRSLETVHRLFTATLKQPSKGKDDEKMYYTQLTSYAAKLVVDEMHKAQTKTYTLSQVSSTNMCSAR